MNCLDEVQLSSCLAFKDKIMDQPNFEIFDKVQEIFINLRNFIFDVTKNLETKIDKIETLYLSR